jgi:pimeloyl-ACP methyl ester carboxylesterase
MDKLFKFRFGVFNALYILEGEAQRLLPVVLGWSLSDGRSKYKVDVTSIVAEKVQLPNGRHFAYVEQGASKEEAKHNVLFAHGLFSSRLLGLSGVNEKLLKKYGVRLVAYDRPGIGQSDPQLKRTLNSSAEDMADIADALGMGIKFWVFAHSEGAAYAWAALHYIPARLAGVAMFGPFMNPYAKNTTHEESKAMWAGLGPMKSTFRYARYLPSFVPGKLKGNVKKVNKYMKSTKKRVNAKDRALLETDAFGEAWERATRESVRSGDPKPQAQDLILQAHKWGFKLSDIRATPPRRSLLSRIFLFWRSALPGFSGPIHIFHGTEDKIAPLVMSEYAKRLLPQVELHRLEGEGHFSWFFNCDSCHRELFKTLFGEVEGLEELDNPVVPDASKEPEKLEKPGPIDAETEAEKIAPVDAQRHSYEQDEF